MRPSIKPAERLSVTLRYLATGKTFKSLKYSFRISPTLISSIITECCEGLYDTLRSEYLKTPTTEDEWLAIAKALNFAIISSKEFQQLCTNSLVSYYQAIVPIVTFVSVMNTIFHKYIRQI